MLKKVENYINTNKLISKGESVLVGVSGGADSVALILVLKELSEKMGFNLFAAHYNHSIRGESADRDEEFVKKLCKRMDVELFCAKEDVKKAAKENSQTLEQAARIMRYAFLRRVKAENKIDHIAVAHHMDDQAESILLHLFRGASLKGLVGMLPKNEDVIRPFLNIRKREILAFLEEKGEAYCTDETNELLDASRNRLRLELIPYIEKHINSNIIETLASNSYLLAEDEAYLDDIARNALKEAQKGEGYDREKLLSLPSPILKRVIRIALFEAGAKVDIEKKHVESVINLLKLKTGAKVNLPRCDAWNEYDTVRFGKSEEKAREDINITFEVGKEVKTSEGSFKSCYTEADKLCYDKNIAFIDLDKLPLDAVYRRRSEGDRFQSVNAPGSKKLKDFFIDKKVKREDRDTVLLASGNEVLFIPGFGVSEKVKISETTAKAVKIVFNKQGEQGNGNK